MLPAWPSTARPDRLLGAKADDARLRIEADALSRPPLAQSRSSSGNSRADGLGVMPDVGAGPRAAADALPAVEPAVLEPVAGRRRQDRGVGERPVQEPVGQRRVVPGLVPEPRLRAEAARSACRRTGRRPRPRRTAWRSTGPALRQPRPGERQVGEVPGDDERRPSPPAPGASFIVRTIAPMSLLPKGFRAGTSPPKSESAAAPAAIARGPVRSVRVEQGQAHRAEVVPLVPGGQRGAASCPQSSTWSTSMCPQSPDCRSTISIRGRLALQLANVPTWPTPWRRRSCRSPCGRPVRRPAS